MQCLFLLRLSRWCLVTLALPLWTGALRAAETGESTSAHVPLGERLVRTTEWELFFDDPVGAKEYAKQLDYFKIELGAEDAKGTIQYASPLSKARPERRIGARENEPRISIAWKKGTLVAVDRKLLGKAGINTQGKKLLHFVPRDLEQKLFKLEQDFADLPPDKIARTQFKIREKKSGDGYEMYVFEQDEKPESPGSRSPNTADEPAVADAP